MSTHKKPFRVLSLDGGGMRGLYTASVLNTLAKRFNDRLDVGKGFDLIVGTSTGGILASALAAGISPEKIIDLYREHSHTIFTCPMPNNFILKLLWIFRNLAKPANSNHTLKDALTSILGTETIGSVYERRKIKLCIPSINVATHKAQIFKTPHQPGKKADNDRTLVEICLASAAAPIIFPVAEVNDPHTRGAFSHYVDGGLWANNPVVIGLIEALEISEQDQSIEIISIGSCPPPSGSAFAKKELQRGLWEWKFGINIVELAMDAQASGYQFMAQKLIHLFNKMGRESKVLRLPQSSPSADQAKFLSLDGISKKALNTLIQLGNADALQVHGKALSGENEFEMLLSIFQSMPIIQ